MEPKFSGLLDNIGGPEKDNEAPPTAEENKPQRRTPPPLPPPVIELSERARAEAQRLIEKLNKQNSYFRLGVKGGGCSGLTYNMTFDDVRNEKDKYFEFEGGVRVVVDPKSFLFLRGMTLDFSDDLIGGGFRFENPNAKRSCSCGTSFSA